MDSDYLMRRMNEERQRAADADHDAARLAHLQLAEHYRQQLDRLNGGRADEAQELKLAGL